MLSRFSSPFITGKLLGAPGHTTSNKDAANRAFRPFLPADRAEARLLLRLALSALLAALARQLVFGAFSADAEDAAPEARRAPGS